tara:strand:+ start:16 stop:363 length:348 start_codon:yes stop_codon:yes gene_type:complete
MKVFNLKEALSGAKVITVGGIEVTQITMMQVADRNKVVGVYKDEVLQWNASGLFCCEKHFLGEHNLDLKMAPEMGKGFLYVFKNGGTTITSAKLSKLGEPIIIFDLSEYPIGFGL